MAFTGRAIYDTDVFEGVAEDVSDLIGMISPFETPLLDRLGDAPRSAANVYHEWLEDELNPNTVASSTALASTTAVSSVEVHVGGAAVTGYLQVGAQLRVKATGEYLQITALSGNYLTVSRAFGGTTAASFEAGAELFIISDAALEGADVSGDISRPRARKYNYTQIFKKDIIVSGTVQASSQLGGIANEFDYQKLQRMRESLRDLEKAAIQGRLSGNTLGASDAYRTMDGIWRKVATNVTSTNTLTPAILNDIIGKAWDCGGVPNLVVVSNDWKKIIDGWNDSRIEVQNIVTGVVRRVTFFEGTYGVHEVMLGRWMPTSTLLALDSERTHIVPLQGRSFQFTPVARTGDSEKGYVLGEYTIEVHNEDGMAKAWAGSGL